MNTTTIQRAPVRVWFASEVVEENRHSTVHLLTRLAAALQTDYDVAFLSTPGGGWNGVPAAVRNGRAPLRRRVLARGARALFDAVAIAVTALRRVRPGDVIITATNPAFLPILLRLVASRRGAQLIIIVHDVYPDVMHAAGVWRRDSVTFRVFDRLQQATLADASCVVVIGRDMQRLVERKLNGAAVRVEFVPNWADNDIITASASLIDSASESRPLVVQYSGNMGVTHDVESLIECAVTLQQEAAPARFEVFGWGLKLPLLHRVMRERGLHNMAVAGPCSREHLAAQLNRCDVALILMIPGMAGISVPCRLYNIMAAGKAVIAAVDANSEVASVIHEYDIGWVVDPGDPRMLAAAIRKAVGDRATVAAMGARARAAAARVFSFDAAVQRYQRIVSDLANGRIRGDVAPFSR